MKTEHIRNIVSLYLAFHKAIPNAARFHFRDLRKMLSPVFAEDELEQVVSDFFSDQNRKILRSDYLFSQASSVRLVGASRLLSRVLSRKEKMLCLAVLFKLIRENGQQGRIELMENVRLIAEVFGFDNHILAALKSIFFEESPAPENYARSVMITSHRPDYVLAVDGLRFVWNEKSRITVWMLSIPEAETIFMRVIDRGFPSDVFDIENGDVIPFHHHARAFLELKKIDTRSLLAELSRPVELLPNVTIAATEMTPQVEMIASERRIELTGNCLAVAAQHFFAPVFRWIERLSQLNPREVSIHVNLHFFNTYSSKILLDIFLRLKRMNQQGANVNFFWYYQQFDDELKESGEYYEEILKVNFNFVEVKSTELNTAVYE